MKQLPVLLSTLLIFGFSHGVIADGHGHSEKDPLETVLASQPEETQQRYSARHPKETLAFFEVQPGDSVLEVLPGGGWYTKILLPYLGESGSLTGIDYNPTIWSNFSFADEEFIAKRKMWTTTWPEKVAEWGIEGSASVNAVNFEKVPESMHNTIDKALYIRALHNLARFNADDGYLNKALADTYAVLKPGGIVGIVQHQAREDRDDAWADGSSGYLKQSFLITKLEEAGFEFVDATDVNTNELDQADTGDIVWRLPPSLNGSKDDEEKKAAMLAIGESNRMTLKFRKPAS